MASYFIVCQMGDKYGGHKVIVVCSQRAAIGALTRAIQVVYQGPHVVTLNPEAGSLFGACHSYST